jgi:inner membrane protein
MDTLTHALSGALIGRATARRVPGPGEIPIGRRMLVGFAAAAFPDIDFLVRHLSPLSYLYQHRGVTHSLLMFPLWAALIALIFAVLWGWKPGWRAYFGVAALGVTAHIAGDLITSFGTMIFAPLSDARYGIGTTFIIDLWLSGIILAGLVASALWRRTRACAIGAIAALVLYVGLQSALQQRAIDFGEHHARANGLEAARVTAQPRPVSPFNWTVFVEDPAGYRYAHVNLIRDTARPQPTAQSGFIATLDAAYRPLDDAQWVLAPRFGMTERDVALAREAFDQVGFRFFRWFAAYPALLEIDRGNPHECVWFQDLRFLTPGRGRTPFRYGMCREAGGTWEAYQLGDGDKSLVY